MNLKDHMILYVDDERANRVVFEATFQYRFWLKTVSGGAAALEVLRTAPVGVLVTDQRMPDMSGNELLLKAKDLYPEVVRIITTAFSDMGPLLKSVNEGLVSRYIIKPWDRSELEQTLRWAVESYDHSSRSVDLQLGLIRLERSVTRGLVSGTDLSFSVDADDTMNLPGMEPESDPVYIIRFSIALCKRLLVGIGGSMLYSGPPVLPQVNMRSIELSQILINLLSNAAQALAAAGKRHGEVLVEASQVGSELRCIVRDQGDGMPQDVMARVGTVFFTTRADGNGLGVAQCQRLLERAGGTLTFQSQLGKGTSVTFTLPLAPSAGIETPPVSEPPSMPRQARQN